MFFKKTFSPVVKRGWNSTTIKYKDKIKKIPTRFISESQIDVMHSSDENDVVRYKLSAKFSNSQPDQEIFIFDELKYAEYVQESLFDGSTLSALSLIKYFAIFLVVVFLVSTLRTNPQEIIDSTSSAIVTPSSGNISNKEAARAKIFQELQKSIANKGNGDKDFDPMSDTYTFNPKISVPPLPAPELKCATKESPQITKIP